MMYSSTLLAFICALCALVFTDVVMQAGASPAPLLPTKTSLNRGFEELGFASEASLLRRTDPTFPPDPPSCPICQQNYDRINNCAQAAPVLANFSEIIFNPGAFINVIQCACTETFQSVFPQCVDCFVQTNQTQVLNAPDLNSVVSGMRQVCALASTLLGGVASTDGELPSTTASPTPTPTSTNAASALYPRLSSTVSGAVFQVMILSAAGVVGGVLLAL
ncbi:hypothetical protein D9758_006564 [Tetrapyrgos nigripes]|uniref:Uncharacterized protein n=1 Tax=Tetrapyrgos nigripes TaxID=182062 RepID=A0A8H5GL48_9AGAR|nr:hypothetical protein D9758_006564 [Tetrapyrgos nigripes]